MNHQIKNKWTLYLHGLFYIRSERNHKCSERVKALTSIFRPISVGKQAHCKSILHWKRECAPLLNVYMIFFPNGIDNIEELVGICCWSCLSSVVHIGNHITPYVLNWIEISSFRWPWEDFNRRVLFKPLLDDARFVDWWLILDKFYRSTTVIPINHRQ